MGGDRGHRSYLRDSSGPRPVEPSTGRDKQRSSGRRQHRDSDEIDKHRPRRTESIRSPKKTSSHRRKHSSPQVVQEKPTIVLDIIGAPSKTIQLGTAIEKTVMISLKMPSSDRAMPASRCETSGLFAMTSLVADTRDGERISVDSGLLCGQRTLDSVQPIPEHCLESLSQRYPYQVSLGYFSFEGLVIRQAGNYRIRTTLVQMGETGATSIAAVDSELIKVEGRTSNAHRRRQRVYQ